MMMMVEVDFYREGGSLFVKLGEGSERVVRADAEVIIDVSGGRVVAVEILFRDKEVVDKLARYLGGGNV